MVTGANLLIDGATPPRGRATDLRTRASVMGAGAADSKLAAGGPPQAAGAQLAGFCCRDAFDSPRCVVPE